MLVFFYIFLAFVFTTVAYYWDKDNDKSQNDDFKGSRLFHRYGREVFSSVIPLKIDPEQTSKPQNQIITELVEYIKQNLGHEFAHKNFFEIVNLTIRDLKKHKDVRTFVRASFTTLRNTKIHTILYFSLLGNQVIIQQSVYLRGNYYWWNVLFFILFSPLTLPLWVRAWFRGEHNIISAMSNRFDKSSFDFLDTVTIFKTMTFLVQILIVKFAKENNIMTEELEKVIINNITNSQNINISQSSGVSFGSVVSSLKKS